MEQQQAEGERGEGAAGGRQQADATAQVHDLEQEAAAVGVGEQQPLLGRAQLALEQAVMGLDLAAGEGVLARALDQRVGGGGEVLAVFFGDRLGVLQALGVEQDAVLLPFDGPQLDLVELDEDVGRRVIVDKETVSQQEALALIDRAVRDATNGRFGGPTSPR